MVSETTQKLVLPKSLKGVRELDLETPPVMIFYGMNGTGKTYFSTSATKVPSLCPVALIAVGTSDYTLKDKLDIDLSQLTVLDPSAYKEQVSIGATWDAIHQVIRSVSGLPKGGCPFRCIILDDLTLMQLWAERRAVQQTPFHQGTSVLLEMTQQGDYRLAKDRIVDDVLQLLELCKREKILLILTGQERLVRVVSEGVLQTDEKGNEVKTYRSSLDLMPSLIQPILGMGAIVGKMAQVGRNFVMTTRRSQYLDAKDTTGALGDSIENPTMTKVVNLLRQKGYLLDKTQLNTNGTK